MNWRALFNVLKVAFAVGLVWWVIHQAGWDNIHRALSNMDRTHWVLGFGVMLLANVIAIYRWHLLMKSVGLNTTPWLAMRLGFIGVFFNNVLPGLTGGDLVKAIYVSRENPGKRARAIMSVVVDRIIGIIALALIAAVVIPFDLERSLKPRDDGGYGEAALGTYGFLAASAVGAVLVLSRRTKRKLRELLARFGRTSKGDGQSLLGRIDEAVSMYRDRLGEVWIAMGLSVVVHMLIIMALMIFGDALAKGGLESLATTQASGESALDPAALAQRELELHTLDQVPLSAYCSIVPIIMIISALPTTPSGWGVGEVLFPFFFKAVGVAKEHAVALSLTYRITTVLVSLLGGLFLAFDRKRVLEAAHQREEDE